MGQVDFNSSAYQFFSPGGPPNINSQGFANSQDYNEPPIDKDLLNYSSALDYLYQSHHSLGAIQSTDYLQTGEVNYANHNTGVSEHGTRIIELRRKNKERRRVLSQTKHQLVESQLKAVQSRQAIGQEVELLSEFLEEALQLIDGFGESYLYVKLIEARVDKIRDIIK